MIKWRKKNMKELKRDLKFKKLNGLFENMLEANVDIHYDPLNTEHFLLDRENQVYLSLSPSLIKLCNHQFRYEIPITLKESEVLGKKVDVKLNGKSESIRKELFKNEVELIDKIKEIYVGS